MSQEPIAGIAGVRVTPLRRIADDRGAVFHMLRADAPHFEAFGEVYFSSVHPGKVKAWHLHREMTLNYAVPVGTIRLVIYDPREGSPTRGQLQELVVGEPDYCLVTVPPGVWSGFQGLGGTTALVANCATLPHQEGEIERADPFAGPIAYSWPRPDPAHA